VTLENVSADHLCQVLAKVEESAASERLMAAIVYKEIADVSQADAAELYGYSEGWASKWFNRLERLESWINRPLFYSPVCQVLSTRSGIGRYPI